MQTKAISFRQNFDLAQGNQFVKIDLQLPELAANDLLVKVAACSVNPVDTKLRAAGKNLPVPHVLGYDGVGEILAMGSGVTNFRVGDQVMYAGTTTRFGSYSEKQIIDGRITAKIPSGLSLTDCAGIPLTFLTAYEVLFEKIRLVAEKAGNREKKLLIINGAGGVGSAAIQLAKWAGLEVIATASRPATQAWVKKLGADLVIDHHQNITQQLAAEKITSLPAILILHSTDDYFAEMANLVGPFGHVASIVETTRPLPLNLLKNKSASWDWEYLFAKTDFAYEVASQGANLQKISRLLEEGQLRPTTTKVLPGLTPETLFAAHQLVEENQMVGKLVIEY